MSNNMFCDKGNILDEREIESIEVECVHKRYQCKQVQITLTFPHPFRQIVYYKSASGAYKTQKSLSLNALQCIIYGGWVRIEKYVRQFLTLAYK